MECFIEIKKFYTERHTELGRSVVEVSIVEVESLHCEAEVKREKFTLSEAEV